jgi:hypothetical protein
MNWHYLDEGQKVASELELQFSSNSNGNKAM